MKRIDTNREGHYYEIREWTMRGWEGWCTAYYTTPRGTREIGRFQSEKYAMQRIFDCAENARLTLVF